jgi:hypothetical protein
MPYRGRGIRSIRHRNAVLPEMHVQMYISYVSTGKDVYIYIYTSLVLDNEKYCFI